jgi:hypothetical protein
VTVTVTPVNDAPVVVGEQYTTQESNPLFVSAPGVLANDSDPDGDALSITGFSQGAHGAVFVGADGSLIYQPFSGFSGTDSFTYTVSDGALSTQGTVSVTVVEGSPIVANDAVIAFRDSSLAIPFATLLANDSDPNGDALFINGSDSTGTQGVVAFLPGGDFLFTPAAGFVGTTSFKYGVTDGFNSAQATVTITVRPPNSVNAVDDSYSFSGPQLAVDAAFGFLANDVDPDGDAFSLNGVNYNGTGQLFVANDGTFLYVPAAGFLGTETFTYTITDALGASDTATVAITVLPANQAPVANDDVFNGTEDTQLLGSVAGNDSDPDGDALTYSLVGPGLGGLVLNQDGRFTYRPPPTRPAR